MINNNNNNNDNNNNDNHYSKKDSNSEKEFRKKIKHEVDVNNRKKMPIDLKRKIYNEKTFESTEDEELFKNEKLKENVFNKLNICTNDNCTNPRCKNIAILYTNKKVGSTSLWGSINLYLSDIFTTYHWHSETYLERTEIYGLSIQKVIELLKLYKKNVYIIDIYRPIFDICLSNYFNELNSQFQKDLSSLEVENKETIVNRFFNLFNHYYNKYNVDYFREKYELPYNSEQFDFEKKYLIVKDETITYIKLRLCDSKEWENILNPILNTNMKCIKHNETKAKSWGNYYDYFLENFSITSEIFESIKNNEYFKFYYSEEEQNNYLSKFNNKVSDKYNQRYTNEQIAFYFKILRENETNINLGYLSINSNAPIVSNCLCDFCKEKRSKMINQYDNNGLNGFNGIINYEKLKSNMKNSINNDINNEKLKRELLNRMIRKQMLTGKRQNVLGKLNFVSNL
jgi:hypothetical protein